MLFPSLLAFTKRESFNIFSWCEIADCSISNASTMFPTLSSSFCKRKRIDKRVGSLITLNTLLIDWIFSLLIGEVVDVSICSYSSHMIFHSYIQYHMSKTMLVFCL